MSSGSSPTPVQLPPGLTILPEHRFSREAPYLVSGTGRWFTSVHAPDVITSKLTEVRDLCFRGGSITLDQAQYARFVGVRFENCAISLDGCWDCQFIDCDFVGYEPQNLPLRVESRHRQTNCLRVERCRFEDPGYEAGRQNKLAHVWIGQGCRKIDLISNKFHGPYTTRLVHAYRVDCLRVLDNNFTHGSSIQRMSNTGLYLECCRDTMVSRNWFDNLAAAMIVTECPRLKLDGNVFPTDQPNRNDVVYR